MITGLSGPLLSHDALEAAIRSGAMPFGREAPPASARHLHAWHAAVRNRLGPSCTSRRVFDLLAEPLARALGFEVVPLSGRSETLDAILQAEDVPAAVMIVTPWGQPAGAAWRYAVHRGLSLDLRWAICVNGPAVRVFDVQRAYARRFAEFSLDDTLGNPASLNVLCGLLGAGAMTAAGGLTALDRAVAFCEAHRADVRRSLRNGVHEALMQLIAGFRRAVSSRHPSSRILDESLIVVYRILFLLFAEARGLVPAWHPIYRHGYTIEALRRQLRERAAPGIWEALQAVARLAHRGCRAGSLRVTPFNGRLFSPSDAPLADTVPLDDRAVGRALVALTTRKGASGPELIAYADLGVDQLGAVYEHLLDFDLETAASAPVLVKTGRRKATGSFYTPRPLTDFLVRRTLAPLVHDAGPEEILALRILDPAMGSGAFLVAACRFLAAAYEQALVRAGTMDAGDVTEDDRATFRRAVAQQCLFGVDVNPMAVQLGRLSLWLATLAADKPLSFLDHHLRPGNSLVGATIEDMIRNPSPGTKGPMRDLPLFPFEALQSSLVSAVASRRSLAEVPDDSLDHVRQKERTLARLNRPGGPLDRWKTAADVWCAAWYPGGGRGSGRSTFGALLDHVLRGSGMLGPRLAEDLLAGARAVAAAQRFFHWTCEFPEIFYDVAGLRRPDGGFDAILTNPPWEMLREDGAAPAVRELHGFVRGSGLYRLQGQGHSNLYQVFVERIAGLLRPSGRAGLILPAGFATDSSAGLLRRFLFDRTSADTFTVIDNRDGIFPVHRALKFLLLTFTAGGPTTELPARAGVRSPEFLDRMPDRGPDADTIHIPRPLIERSSAGDFAVPEIRTPLDLEILSHVSFDTPALEDSDGWGIHFGRELNATDDRPHFREDGRGMPVLEGKHLRPFAVDLRAVRHTISDRIAGSLLDPDRTFRRARLGYREVASSTNRTTLIAAIVPAGTVTTHTIFCLREPLDAESQYFLCGVFNSYVANYLVRMRVSTHVTAAIMARLAVPKPHRDHPAFTRIARLGKALSRKYHDAHAARLNALVATLYRLSIRQFARILDTFPLIPERERSRALEALTRGPG